MRYPLDILVEGPNGQKPYIIFVAVEPKYNIGKSLSHKDAFNTGEPIGGFVLPFPAGGLIDSQTNSYTQENAFWKATVGTFTPTGGTADLLSQSTGMVADPLMTNVYQGSTPRKWEATWDIIPQSAAESAMVALMLSKLKKWAAPDRTKTDKLGMLIAPHNWKIIFGNSVIQQSMQFNDMVLENYSINYFAQGYPSTTKDLMPKHISLSLSFSEFGIKYRKDWMT